MRLVVALALVGWSCAPEHSVQNRAYELSSPAGDEAVPLLVLLHGYSASGPLQDAVFPFSKLQTSKKFHYALPNGTLDRVGKRFWNATDFCCDFEKLPVNDVDYLRALIADVKAQRKVKPGHVFFVGHSNGAFMSLRMACEASDVVDGIAAVSGSTWTDFSQCPDGRKIPILLVHGTDDETILYDGAGAKYPSAHVTGERFARRAGCNGPWTEKPRLDLVGDSATETKVETIECTTPLELWSVEGAPHLPSFNDGWTAKTFEWLEERVK